MNVYPRKPLWAKPYDDGMSVLGADLSLGGLFTDAEFAANFYPAELLDALIAAVGALDATITTTTDAAVAKVVTDVCAAFRAFREQVTA